jgi:hypothetical protein
VHGQSFLPQSVALFAAMTTPPTTARKILINNTIGALLSAGIWSQLDVLYVLAAADNQAARLNWINPSTFMALPVNAPTFAVDRGYTGDGSSSRLRTQYTPSVNGVNFTQNSASIWVWSRTQAQGAPRDVGSVTGTTMQSSVSIRNTSDNMSIFINDGTAGTPANSNSVGFFGSQRVSSTTKRAWGNGAQVGADVTLTSVGLPVTEQWTCGANSTSFSTRQQAAAAWGASLSGLESAFYNSLLPYMQAVGASS